MMSQCQAITRNGNKCKKKAINGSQYCSIPSHQGQKKNNINIPDKKSAYHLWPTKKQWNKWSLPSKLTAIGVFISAIGLILVIPTYFSGATKSDVKESEKNVVQGQNYLLKRQDIILEILKTVEKTNREDLMKKYSIGYALFYKDSTHPMIPWNTNIPINLISIGWDSAKILKIDEERAFFRAPDFIIYNKMGRPDHTVENTEFIVTLKSRFYYLLSGMNGITCTVEIIESNKNNFIGVIGFNLEN